MFPFLEVTMRRTIGITILLITLIALLFALSPPVTQAFPDPPQDPIKIVEPATGQVISTFYNPEFRITWKAYPLTNPRDRSVS